MRVSINLFEYEFFMTINVKPIITFNEITISHE